MVSVEFIDVLKETFCWSSPALLSCIAFKSTLKAELSSLSALIPPAAFVNSSRLHIKKVDGTEEDIEFENAIVATGSVPTKIPGLSIDSPRVIDSTGALELNDVPKKLLVVGGGYIGLEMGTVYSALGSKVSVVEMTPSLLPGADKDLVNVLKKSIDAKMEAVYLNTKVVKMEDTGKAVKVTFEGNDIEQKEQLFDKVLVSIGRSPVTQGLGLENTKVKLPFY